jgi:hypothetical protein
MKTTSSETAGYKDALFGVVTLLLGLLVGVLGFVALLMWLDARNTRHDANRIAATGMSSTANLGSLTSFAGATPANADALAAAHKPYPAALPAALPGPVADVHLVLTDLTIEIAPGVKYAAWAWAGGAPGPVIHVHQGRW